MGADIHIYAEKKITMNYKDTWVYYRSYERISSKMFDSFRLVVGDCKVVEDAIPDPINLWYRVDGRHYDFFAALAGVRGLGPEPKGLPDDMSFVVKYKADSWGADGHSHSWYYAEDFLPIFLEHHTTPEERKEYAKDILENGSAFTMSKALDQYLGIDTYIGEGLNGSLYETNAYRFVFWFDN